MSELRFVGVSDDGSALVMQDAGEGTFTLSLDEVVAAAVRRDRHRHARLENEMDGALRPRDIQARIRSGASIDDVVAESGLSHERVERFAGPMLAEREHVAILARGTEIRRDFAPDLDLEAAVAERLEPLGVESGSLSWDAWRRDDGRWVVEAAYVIGREQRSGHWAFDHKASSLAADDDEGRWLIDPNAAEPDSADRGKPRLASVRSLSSVADAAAPAAVQAEAMQIVEEIVDVDIEIVNVEVDEALVAIDDFSDDSDIALTVLDAQSHADVADIAEAVEEQLTLVETNDAGTGTGTDEAPAPKTRTAAAARQPAKRKGRASVPTWDDIVFGARKSTD